MTTRTLRIAFVLTLAGMSLAWKALDKVQKQPSAPTIPTQRAQAVGETAKKFDLTTLPRALELPLLQTPLQPGDLAPDFELPDQSGRVHRLSELHGQTVVLSFYPRDLTFTCVAEALSFDSNLPAFHLRDTKVFSVSVQNVDSKALFAERYHISYPLLADTSKTTARNYRVLSKDGVAGRVTFVIGPDGRIMRASQKVDVQTHAKDVLAFIDRQRVHRPPLVQQMKPRAQRYAVNSISPRF